MNFSITITKCYMIRKETRFPIIFSAGVDNKAASRPEISVSLCKTLSRKARGEGHKIVPQSWRGPVSSLRDGSKWPPSISDAKWQRTAIRISRLFPTYITTQLTDVVYEGVNRSDRDCSINPINSCVRAATTPHGYGAIINGEDDEAETRVSEAETAETPCMIRHEGSMI